MVVPLSPPVREGRRSATAGAGVRGTALLPCPPTVPGLIRCFLPHLLLAAPAYSRPSCNPATSLPVIVLICFSGMPAVNGCRCAHCATLIGSPGHECMYKTSYTVSAEVMPTSALLDPTVALLFAGLVPPCQAVEQRSSTFKCTHHGCSSQGVR